MKQDQKKYRESQLNRVINNHDNSYNRTIKISSTDESTNCLDISEEEFKAIQSILTKGVIQ